MGLFSSISSAISDVGQAVTSPIVKAGSQINDVASSVISNPLPAVIAYTTGNPAALLSYAPAVSSALSGTTPGGTNMATASNVTSAADPFADYRTNIASLYSGALTNKTTDVTQMPGFSQFQTGVVDPALEASKRSSAASGMLRSGNEQIALQKTGQQGYYGFMQDYMNRLAQGSGATNNPATAVGMGVSQGNLNQASQMQMLGGAIQGISSIFGSGSSNTFGTSAGGILGSSSGLGFDLSMLFS